MTIITDRQLYAASPQRLIRSRAGGQSFAARIEAGDRAKDIVQDRALGFAEAGLLGLHYAHDSSNKAAYWSERGIRADSTPDAIVPNGTKLYDNAVAISGHEVDAVNVRGNSGQTGGNLGTKGAAPPVQSAQYPESALPSLDVVVVSTDDTANELPSPFSKSFQKALSPDRPGIKFGLKVIETPHGISIICEESAVSENEIQELTDLAQQIAKDFGVTIRRLVVNGKNSV